MGLILFGVVGTTMAVGASETAIANWMTPSRMRPRVHHWFRVSPDEKQVAACEWKAGETPRRRVLDIRTGAQVEIDLTDPTAWVNDTPKDWYSRRQSQSAGGAAAVTITWTGHPMERTFMLDRGHMIWLTTAEGVVFEHVRDNAFYSLMRHDLASGESRTIVRANPRADAAISPDGERVLLNENALVARKNLPEQRGVKILDGRDGSELGWIEAPWVVVWLDFGHRHVQTQLDGRLTVIDLERGTKVPLETHFSTLAPVHVLPDGGLLLQDGDALTLHDGTTGELLSRL